MAKTRAIRVSDEEEKLIREFLAKNPFFDFSSLARTAIINFINEPTVTIQPIRPIKKSKKRLEHRPS